jgi:hypothetical protein
MNRVRIRVGQKIREFGYALPNGWHFNILEDTIRSILCKEWQIVGWSLEYLGEYSWDIMLDGQKIGHIKAWKENVKLTGKQLWSYLLLFFGAYLALC